MPFQVTSRQAIVFVAGLAFGIAGAWALFAKHPGAAEPTAQKQSPAASAKAMGAGPVSVAVGACAFTPVVSTAASDDGRVNVQAELSGRGPKEIDAWLLDGKEAVAAGRQRDAEADFLMACRAAEQLGDAGVLPQAEAMYHLGRHYAGLAGAAPEFRSGELWKRAGSLFAASLKAFDARYGNESDKTRFAAKGLAEVQAHTGGAPTVAAAPAPAVPAPVKAPEAKVAKLVPPAPVKVAPPKEDLHAAAPVVEPTPAPVPKAASEPKAAPEPKVVAEPKSVPEPKVAAEPRLAPEPKIAREPNAAPEPKLAAVKPTPPAPRPSAPAVEATGEATGEATISEPPARAAGSARGRGDEPVESSN